MNLGPPYGPGLLQKNSDAATTTPANYAERRKLRAQRVLWREWGTR